MTEMRETEGELIKSFNDKDNDDFMEQPNLKKRFLIISVISILTVVIIIFLILFFTIFKKDKDNKENYDYPTELDTIPSEELNKARKSFLQYNFIDIGYTSKNLPYNLFVPENYNETQNKKYPLIVFIGDASTVGKEVNYPLIQTVGGPIWATDTVQKKHKCFVLVPEYSEVIIDDRNGYSKSDYINITERLIASIQTLYKIDQNKIYGTGQSMGAMTTLYLLANSQNLYAAGLIVDGQWIKEELLGLVNSTFTYFAAGGDEKAFNGQNEIKEYFDSKNLQYGCLTDINAQENVDILNNITREMYNKNITYYFITYINGSVFPSNSKSSNEHMASFKYGYRIETVRDWLFEQNKIKCNDGLFYSEDGKCSFTNFCAKTRNDFYCSECIYGYYLSDDKSSCTNDTNCRSANKETGICSLCMNDYYFDLQEKKCKLIGDIDDFKHCKIVDKGICIECDSFYYLDQNSKCTITQNCLISKDSLCIECKEGYYLGLDHKCCDIEKCIYSSNNICNECKDGFYYDQIDKMCKEAEGNFKNCKYNSEWEQTQCASCKTNYCLNQSDYYCYDNTSPGPYYKCQVSDFYGEFCYYCIDEYYLGNIDLNCSKIEGCLKSLDENTCLKCDKYYCLDNLGNCTDNSYVISDDKKYYFRCKMLNEDGSKCELCDHSINTTDEGICYDDYHCIKDEAGECIRCQEDNPRGYPTFCFNKEFGCVDSFITNCIRCDNIFDMDVCTECEDGYEIDEYGNCVEIEEKL